MDVDMHVLGGGAGWLLHAQGIGDEATLRAEGVRCKAPSLAW